MYIYVKIFLKLAEWASSTEAEVHAADLPVHSVLSERLSVCTSYPFTPRNHVQRKLEALQTALPAFFLLKWVGWSQFWMQLWLSMAQAHNGWAASSSFWSLFLSWSSGAGSSCIPGAVWLGMSGAMALPAQGELSLLHSEPQFAQRNIPGEERKNAGTIIIQPWWYYWKTTL